MNNSSISADVFPSVSYPKMLRKIKSKIINPPQITKSHDFPIASPIGVEAIPFRADITHYEAKPSPIAADGRISPQ